jgi:hypothetical protein
MRELPACHPPAPPRDLASNPTHEGSLAAQPLNQPSGHAIELRLIMPRVRSWFNRLVALTLVRFLLVFFVGVVTTLAWQSYSDAGRHAIAGWCRSIAPETAPVAQNVSSLPVAQNVSSLPVAQNVSPSSEDRVPVSPDQLKAMSDLLKAALAAAVRESVDKLAEEITKLQTVDRGTPDRASLATGMPPASRPPPAPTRAPPSH